jgi:hypothetical protein
VNYQHLNFFQHDGVPQGRTPRTTLPGLRWGISGFELLFEAVALMRVAQMEFADLAHQRRLGASAVGDSSALCRLVSAACGFRHARPFGNVRHLRLEGVLLRCTRSTSASTCRATGRIPKLTIASGHS